MKKVIVLILLLALAAALLGCGSSASGIGNPIKGFKTQVQNNQYIDALETFTNKIHGDSSLETEAADFLKDYLNSAWQSYLDETISKKDFDAILLTIQKIDEKINKLGWDLKEIQAEYPEVSASKEAYQNGVSQMADGNYEAAMSSFSQVEAVDTKNYQEAQDRFIRAKEEYIKAIITNSQEKLNTGDYDGATSMIETAERTIGNQPGFEQMKTEIATKHFEEQMKAQSENGNFVAMYSIYNQAVENNYCVISAEMTQLFSENQQKFRQGIINRSIEAYKKDGYTAAIPIISEGLATIPDDEKLLKYDELYKSCAPVSLINVQALNGTTGTDSAVSDLFGNTYTGYISLYSTNYDNSRTQYNELVLNGKYSHLSAICFPDTEGSVTIELTIYADGIEIFRSGMMDQKTEPIPIELDIENVKFLKLEVYSGNADYNCWPEVFIVNSSLTRTLTDTDLSTISTLPRAESLPQQGGQEPPQLKELEIRYLDDVRTEITIKAGEIVTLNAFFEPRTTDSVKWTTDDPNDEYIVLTVNPSDHNEVAVECLKECEHSINIYAELYGERQVCAVHFK